MQKLTIHLQIKDNRIFFMYIYTVYWKRGKSFIAEISF